MAILHEELGRSLPDSDQPADFVRLVVRSLVSKCSECGKERTGVLEHLIHECLPAASIYKAPKSRKKSNPPLRISQRPTAQELQLSMRERGERGQSLKGDRNKCRQ